MDNKKNKKKKGFTLVEMIAVMGIIAILATILVPKVIGYIKEARKTEVIDQARKVVLAVESINIKLSNSLTKDNTVSDVISKSGELLKEDDVTKLGESTTVELCYKIIETDKFNILLQDDNTFKNVEPIDK
ncbi:type II secretion system protein [Clostridium septicum]|uniref:type II secretion system protein n=1 Tax=Clostridium septicum TaxID=1504 RepID=UPI00083725D1|nr:type II secretion system protein [Clostridium septicum]